MSSPKKGRRIRPFFGTDAIRGTTPGPPTKPRAADHVDVTIASGGHDVADARLHRIATALVRAGLSVEVLGLGDPSGAPAGVIARTHPRLGRGRRLLDALVMPWQARGRVLLVIAPEMVPMASVVRRLRRRGLVVDVFEDYARLAHDRPFSSPARFAAVTLVRLTTALTARADLTTVADDHVPPRDARRRLVVRNLPDRDALPPPTAPSGKPRAIYIGDVRRSRGLQLMLEAIELAPDWSLDVVGPVAAADEPWLKDWERSSPAASRVRMHGRMPPAASWHVAVGAWVGLSLLEDTPAFRDAVPSKIYEYAAAGLPVIATPLPRVRAIVRESGGGVCASTASEVAQALHGWQSDPDSLAACRAAAMRWAAATFPDRSPYDDLAALVAKLSKE